jgi:hypothetical protein
MMSVCLLCNSFDITPVSLPEQMKAAIFFCFLDNSSFTDIMSWFYFYCFWGGRRSIV